MSALASLSLVALGFSVLLGWDFDLDVLKNLSPSFVSMKPNTAVLFILLGCALWMSIGTEARPRLRMVLAAVIVALGLSTTAESVFGLELGIDKFLLPDTNSIPRGTHVARMSPAASINFTLLGLALLARRPGKPDSRLARCAVLAAALNSFVALAGYVFSVRSLYTVEPYASTALHTVFGFMLASTAFFTARPREGLMAVATSRSAAGVLLRRVLPLALFGTAALHWLQLLAERAELFDSPFRLAVLTVADVLLLFAVLATAAARLHHSNAELGASEERYRLMVEAIRGHAIFTLDADGNVATWNAGATRLLGYDSLDVLGRPSSMLHPREAQGADDSSEAQELEIAKREGRFEGENWWVRANGTRLWASVATTAIYDAVGTFTGFVQIVRDVTARRRAEHIFRLVIEASPTGMLVTDVEGCIVMVNAQTERLFGYEREELIGRQLEILLSEREGDAQLVKRYVESSCFAEGNQWESHEMCGVRKDGSEVPIEASLTTVKLADGELVLSSVVDTTERKRAERQREELIVQKKVAAQLQERSRFFELSLDMVCIANTAGRFVQINPAFSHNLGYSTEELLARPIGDFVHPDDREETMRELTRLATEKMTLDFSNRYICKNGSQRWFQWRAIGEGDGTIYAVARDVTRDHALVEALQEQQATLSASLKEREVLLQEVHHRVKNNLQVVSSLINLQLFQLKDHTAREALEECRSRVETIALIHEKLYQAHDYARIPFSEYVRSLADYILRASKVAARNISLEVSSDEVLLPVDRAIPCALMLNEIVTNSLKHAFPNGRSGTIKVELRKADDQIRLAISDDGVGIPADFELGSARSLGMKLVRTLTEQLEGHLEIARGAGTTFRVEFAVEGHA